MTVALSGTKTENVAFYLKSLPTHGVEELWEFLLNQKSTPIVTGLILTNTHILTGISGEV